MLNSRPHSTSIALWTIYPREIKWFSFEHIINKCHNKCMRQSRIEKKLKQKEIWSNWLATFCLTTRLMDYKSVSKNGHQLPSPLHQDNVNLTTLQLLFSFQIFVSTRINIKMSRPIKSGKITRNLFVVTQSDKKLKNHSW
jgi:hypothetical protein